MGFFDRFKSQSQSVIALSMQIMDASYKCGQAFKTTIDNNFGADSKEAKLSWVQIQYEFLFFFTHLAMRFAFVRYGDTFRNKLQNSIGPILRDATTEAWFGNWPDNLKAGIRDKFFHNIEVADCEYADCNELLVENEPFSNKALLSKLSRNIARLSGAENKPDVIMQCLTVSVEQFKTIKFDILLESSHQEL